MSEIQTDVKLPTYDKKVEFLRIPNTIIGLLGCSFTFFSSIFQIIFFILTLTKDYKNQRGLFVELLVVTCAAFILHGVLSLITSIIGFTSYFYYSSKKVPFILTILHTISLSVLHLTSFGLSFLVMAFSIIVGIFSAFFTWRIVFLFFYLIIYAIANVIIFINELIHLFFTYYTSIKQ